MRDYSRVSARFWTGATGKALRRNPDAQRLALYLLTCPAANMIGVFYVAAPTICHEVGLEAETLAALWVVLELLDFAYYDEETEMVWVPNMAREQLDDTLKPSDKRVVQVVRQVDSIRRHRFARLFWDRYAEAFSLPSHGEAEGLVTLFATPSKGLRSPSDTPSKGKPSRTEEQDQEKEKETEGMRLSAVDLQPEADPAPIVTASKVWTVWQWRAKYGNAWCDKYGGTAIGGDGAADGKMREHLEALGETELLAAQERAPQMFAEFLADEGDAAGARHRWSWFVGRWNALRLPRAAGKKAGGSKPSVVASIAREYEAKQESDRRAFLELERASGLG